MFSVASHCSAVCFFSVRRFVLMVSTFVMANLVLSHLRPEQAHKRPEDMRNLQFLFLHSDPSFSSPLFYFFFSLFHLQSYIYIQWAGNSDYFLHNLYYAKLIANFVCRWWMRTPLDGRWKNVPPPLFAEECGIIDLCEVGGRGTFFSHDREMALPRIQPTNHTHALS